MSCCEHCDKKDFKSVHTCGLCLQPTYCSDECRVVDWARHHGDCTSLVDAPANVGAVFVPHFFQDTMSVEDVRKTAPTHPMFAAHQVRNINSNGIVSFSTIQPIVSAKYVGAMGREQALNKGRGADAADGTYTISVQIGDATKSVSGKLSYDTIHVGNKQNAAAAMLAGKGTESNKMTYETRSPDEVVFWPKPKSVAAMDVRASVGVPQRVTVTVASDELAEPITISGQMTLHRISATKHMEKIAKTKNISKDIQAVYAENADGDTVTLCFSGDKLVDIECGTCGKRKKDKKDKKGRKWDRYHAGELMPTVVKTRFTCNPTKIEDVTALCMAMDERIAEHEARRELLASLCVDSRDPALAQSDRCLDDLRYNFAIVRDHRQKLEDSPTAAVPVKVKSAINTSVEQMFTPIESAVGDDFRRKLLERGPEGVESVINKLSQDLEKYRKEPKNFVQKRYFKVRKGILRKQLQEIITILTQLGNDSHGYFTDGTANYFRQQAQYAASLLNQVRD
jgi:hypothetical protein